MDRAAKGEEIVVTRRGVPYVRLLPAATPTKPSERYPLRGSVLWIADDFDAPMTELWDALTK
jgi:prevent-host-death family protein